MTKLDTDPASAAAKPGSAAPAKVLAPPPSTHDPKTGSWVRFWQDKPQHWGVPSSVKSPVDLAAANVDSTDTLPRSKSAAVGSDVQHFASNGSRSVTFSPLHEGQGGYRQASDNSTSTLAQRDVADAASEAPPAAVSGIPAPVTGNSHVDASGMVAAARQAPPSSAAAALHPPTSVSAVVKPSAAGPATATPAAAPLAAAAAVPVPAAAATAAATATTSAVPAQDSAKLPPKSAAFNMYSPSKGTLQVLRKPPSKDPSPKKQAPLDQMLSRQAAQAQARARGQVSTSDALQQQDVDSAQAEHQHAGGASDTDHAGQIGVAAAQSRVVLPHAVQLPQALQLPTQLHQHAKLQGLALSQIDASVFAALPAQHQQELLQKLPKTTSRAPAGSADEASRQVAASDFAFVTKLANLQKAGHGPLASLDSEIPAVPGALPQAAPDSLRAEVSRPSGSTSDAVASGSGSPEPTSQHEAQLLQDSMLPPMSTVSEQAASEDAGANAEAKPDDLGDPAFVSQLSADSAVDHAAQPVSDGALSRFADKPAACGRAPLAVQQGSVVPVAAQQKQQPDHAEHVKSVQPAQQAQSVQHTKLAQQAQHAQQANADLPHGDTADLPEAVGRDDRSDLDQALDMDLMEEEWVALAAQGQPQAANQPAALQAPIVGSAAHGSDQLGSEGIQGADSPSEEGQAVAGMAAQQAQQQAACLRSPAARQQHVSALPPASQIDSSVLDALPLQVRRELELAYGRSPCMLNLACSMSINRTILQTPHGLWYAAQSYTMPSTVDQ